MHFNDLSLWRLLPFGSGKFSWIISLSFKNSLFWNPYWSDDETPATILYFSYFFSPIFHLCLYFSSGVNHLTSLSYLSMGCYILCSFYFYECLFALRSDFTSAQHSGHCDCFPKLPSSSHIASVPLSSFFCLFGFFPWMLASPCLSACIWGCVGVVNGGLWYRAIWLEDPWISGSIDPLGCAASQEGIP